MLETSQDILHWALAIGSFAALLALAYMFIYMGLIIRQFFKMTTTIEGAFDAVKKIFDSLGEKISNASTLGKFAVDVVKLVNDASDLKEEFVEGKKKKGGRKKK